MPNSIRQPARLERRWRIASVLFGFALSGASGWCMLTGRGGLLALVGKLFYPGLLTSIVIIRQVNLSTILMAFLLNAIFYLLLSFLILRWRMARGS